MMKIAITYGPKAEEDHRLYAEDSERRIQEVHQQMEHLQSLVVGHGATAEPTRGTHARSESTRLGETDDVEAYLTTFERIMEVVNEMSRERWPFQLAP